MMVRQSEVRQIEGAVCGWGFWVWGSSLWAEGQRVLLNLRDCLGDSLCQNSESRRTRELGKKKEGWTEGQKNDSEGAWNLLVPLRGEAKFFFPFFLEGLILADPAVTLMYIRGLFFHFLGALHVDDKTRMQILQATRSVIKSSERL